MNRESSSPSAPSRMESAPTPGHRLQSSAAIKHRSRCESPHQLMSAQIKHREKQRDKDKVNTMRPFNLRGSTQHTLQNGSTVCYALTLLCQDGKRFRRIRQQMRQSCNVLLQLIDAEHDGVERDTHFVKDV